MSRPLPARPNLEHLRRQARDLLRALKAGDPEALARAAPFRLPDPPRLAGAQLVLAREHGCASWPRLVEQVERRLAVDLPDADFVARVVDLAIGRGHDAPQPARALGLAATRRVRSLTLALVLGELETVRRELADVHARLPPFDAPAIAYVAGSSLARLDTHRPQLVEVLAWLLARGADPNARWVDPVFPADPLPVLYGATARAGCHETVRLLLEAGADPNDGESLYHAAEQDDRRILGTLVAAGARWQGTHALLRQLDHDDLDGLQQALDLGADPNEPGPAGMPPLHHALIRGRSLPFLKLLVERGADPRALDAQDRSAAAIAARTGDRAALAWLVAQGAAAPTGAREDFLIACAAADGTTARAHLAAHPSAIADLDAAACRLLPDQAQRGRLASVRLMLELGWPVATRGDWDASALNQAAFRGDAAMVRLLLDHGARWHEPNGFGGNALGSCLHAARNQPEPTGDYAAVLALLLGDGAPPPERVDELPQTLQDVVAAAAGS